MTWAFKIGHRDSELKKSSTFVHQNKALMAKNLVIVESQSLPTEMLWLSGSHAGKANEAPSPKLMATKVVKL